MMQNHKNELTSKQIAEKDALLARGLPDGYGEDVPEMDGEEDPRNRHERRRAAAEARQEAGRRKKAAAKRRKARKNKKRKRRR